MVATAHAKDYVDYAPNGNCLDHLTRQCTSACYCILSHWFLGQPMTSVAKVIANNGFDTMRAHGEHCYYQLLGISSDASRDEIEQACLALWYRYQPMRRTLLWKDIDAEIERIHDTLINADARQAYDNRFKPGKPAIGTDKSGTREPEGREAATVAAPLARERGVDRLHEKSKLNFLNVLELDALAASFGFNQSIDWVRPESWADISSVAWLSLLFCVAGSLLIWSVLRLKKASFGKRDLARKMAV